jgi:hypothetical protein
MSLWDVEGGIAGATTSSRRRSKGDLRRDGVGAGLVSFIDDEPVPVGSGPLSATVGG